MIIFNRYPSKLAAKKIVKDLLKKIPIDFGGGCSVEKATDLAHLIRVH
jgi:hypothetical protein